MRDVGRYRYEATVGYAVRVGRWHLQTTGRLVSDAFEGASGRLAFRDEWRAGASLWRPGGSGRAVGMRIVATGFPQSQVYSHHAQGVYRVAADALLAELRGGLALEGRPGAPLGAVSAPALRQDAGPAAGASFALMRQLGAYALTVQALADGALVGPRRRRDARAVLHLMLPEAASRFEGRLTAASVRRDAYGAASFLNRTDAPAEAIEATASDTLEGGLAFEAPLLGALRWSLGADGGFVVRRVRFHRAPEGALVFDTDFRRQRFDGEGAVAFSRGAHEARLVLSGGAAREERTLVNAAALPVAEATQKADLLEQADFDRGHLALAARFRTGWGRWSAALEALREVTRLDTPERNPDDRDEARGAVTAALQVWLHPTLAAGLEVTGTDLQTVYLRRARSAESQRRRSLRLRPFLDLSGDRTRLRLTSEVRATYTRDRFRMTTRDPADASAREWRTEADLGHTFARDLRLDVALTVSDLRLARLAVDRFAEVPTDTIRTLGVRLMLLRGRRSRVGFGARLFERSDYERSVTVTYAHEGAEATLTRPGRSRLRQVGPLALVVVPVRGRSFVQLEGWLARQHTWAVLRGTLPPAIAAAARGAARRGTARMLPQATLGAVWRW
ncbi:MAG TPA: hypothetical protein VD948_09025 [Rhodothermales bacterium]|nr:hypothetical protein [Rhodothermales bacterium]